MEILGQNEGKETVRERNSQMPALADSCAVQPAVNGNPGSKHLTLALKKMIGWRKSLIRWGVTPEAIRMSIQRPQVPVERPLRERDRRTAASANGTLSSHPA